MKAEFLASHPLQLNLTFVLVVLEENLVYWPKKQIDRESQEECNEKKRHSLRMKILFENQATFGSLFLAKCQELFQ